MTRVAGLDLSLTCSGFAMIDHHGAVTASVVKTTAADRIERRLSRITGVVCAFAEEADHVVIEDGVYHRVGGGHEELAALRLMVRSELWFRGVPFTMVRPSTLKLYTTGSGTASKDEMVSAVDGRHGTLYESVRKAHGRYDMADATALAAMGLHRLLGFELPSWATSPHTASLDAVFWNDTKDET